MAKEDANQFELSNPPTDGITKALFCHHSNRLIVSSWDKSVTIYEINAPNSKQIHSYEHKAPVLDISLSEDDLQIFSAGADYRLLKCDIKSGQSDEIGQHYKPIRCVEYSIEGNMVITGSWDKTIKVWDPRSHNALISTHQLPNKVFAMSISQYHLVIGMAGRQVWIYDIRNMQEPEQKRESSLKHQTRCIKTHPDGEQFILSSIEGRVAVEYFDTKPEIQEQKYAFKCHRVTDKQTGIQTIYPVNAIAFHPVYKTFASGGCDGAVNIWDGNNKKRICQFPAFASSISSLDFNHDGTLLAVAQSYTWEQGPKPVGKDTVFFKHIKESEVKPKAKKKK